MFLVEWSIDGGYTMEFTFAYTQLELQGVLFCLGFIGADVIVVSGV